MRFLGLDVGTTVMKCGVYGEDGELLYMNAAEYGERSEGVDSYVDIEAIWDCALGLLGEAYAAQPFDALAVSSLGESFVLLDENDGIVHYPMLYTDPRGKEEAGQFAPGAAEIFAVSGVYPQNMYSVYKLMWIKNDGRVYARAKKAMLVNEYVAYRLTGERAVDYSQAARTGAFDVRKKVFSEELCGIFDVDASLFSPPVPIGSVVGEVKAEICEKWGTNRPIRVVAGAHDQVCAALGSGVHSEGACCDGMGTVECVTAVFKDPPEDARMGAYGYPVVPFADGLYCTYLLNYSCGSLTRKWASVAAEGLPVAEAYAKLERDFTEEPTGILVLPYFAGAACPYQNIDAKGAMLNLSLSDSSSRMYQGILEGLCYEMKLNLDIVAKYGINVGKIVAAGGGSASRKWLEIKANVFGLPVYPLEVKEAGVCGAAMLAAKALTGKSLAELTERFVRLGKPVMPEPATVKKYADVYKKYKKLYKTIKEFY